MVVGFFLGGGRSKEVHYGDEQMVDFLLTVFKTFRR